MVSSKTSKDGAPYQVAAWNKSPSHARDMHSITMQEQPVTMHSSFNLSMSGITCIT